MTFWVFYSWRKSCGGKNKYMRGFIDSVSDKQRGELSKQDGQILRNETTGDQNWKHFTMCLLYILIPVVLAFR